MYEEPLSRNPNIVLANPGKYLGTQLNQNRLFKMEDTMLEHERMKEKFQNLFAKGLQRKEYMGSLWSIYSGMKPSYARFGTQMRKNNFSNVMMPINGVNIILSNTQAKKRE